MNVLGMEIILCVVKQNPRFDKMMKTRYFKVP